MKVDEVLKLVHTFKNKKVIVFGTGKGGKVLSELLDLLSINISYYVDNNTSKWNTEFRNTKIYSPLTLNEEDKSNIIIFIASMYYDEIANQLEKMGFKENVHYWDGLNFKNEKIKLINEKKYYQDNIGKRNKVIMDIYKSIDIGIGWEDAILDSRAINHGERIVQYPFMASWFLTNTPQKVLDIGCVLNNKIIDPYIHNSVKLNFLSPSFESIIRDKAIYYKMKLGEYSANSQYDMVSCLSTIEYIGFDNLCYSSNDYDIGWDWEKWIDEFIKSIVKLLSFVKEGGSLIISAPYGKKEFIRLPPITGRCIGQVIHTEHLNRLEQILNSDNLKFKYYIFKLNKIGWIRANKNDYFESYGSIGPGSSGVLILEIIKT